MYHPQLLLIFPFPAAHFAYAGPCDYDRMDIPDAYYRFSNLYISYVCSSLDGTLAPSIHDNAHM